MIYDIIIAGGGVAGMTAALYAKRSGKTVLILEEETIGGQAALSPKIENIPSIESIKGSDFTDRLFEQVLSLGAEVELEKVEGIEKINDLFVVHTNYGDHSAKSIILANGVRHKHLNLRDEEEMIGKGISYCAVCDGAFYKDEEVALVGDGNTALQYALLLSSLCKKVYVLTLFDRFFGDDALVKALYKKDNVEVIQNVAVVDYETDEKGELSAVIFKERYGEEETKSVEVKALFIAIGQIPDNKRFKNLAELDEEGFYITSDDMSCKVDGVYAAGDCRKKKVRQVSTACADGAIAAVSANNYLERQGF